MTTRGAYNLGSLRGLGSSTRMYNFCRQTNPEPWTCIDEFIQIEPPLPPAPPAPGKMKTVFLLELTAGAVQPTDISLKNTLNYYWNTYPQEFISCPIVDTEGSLYLNISFLNQYYNLGYRYFVGFTNSNILTGVLDWFNFHSDATGMTIFGVSTTLSIPKNIYRFLPDNRYRIKGIQTQIQSATKVYYIYESSLLVGIDILNLLQEPPYNLSLNNTLFVYQATSTNLTDTNINNFLSGSSSSDIILTLLSLIREQYINLYNQTLDFSGNQYDITATQLPSITGTAATKLSNKYNAVTFQGVNTSIIWRNGYNDLGATNYNVTALNVLNLLNQFSNNNLVDNVNSHYSSLIFDPVTKDMLYPNILLQIFINNNFNDSYLYIEDPYLGTYNATLTGFQEPITTIAISPNKPFYGKAIALLELTNYIYNSDVIIKDSIYYCWYKDNLLPKFPIIDTFSSDNINSLLQSYYDQGYRVFLGMNRPIIIQNALYWFQTHPDVVGIVNLGAAIIPNIPENIFILQVSNNDVIGIFSNTILTPAQSIYYIYTKNNVTAESILEFLNNYYGNKVKPLPLYTVPTDPSYNCNPTTLNAYFADISANAVVATFLEDVQSYINVYNDPSMNQIYVNQYITNIVTPSVITGIAQTTFNNRLFTLSTTFPNTSTLWNEVREYLTTKYGTPTTSFGTVNSLKMIEYILAGKDTKLLGSHSGVLQFNPTTRLLQYPSVLLKQYQQTSNTFINYNINFVDPLLGSFTASFVS